jgi:hypothetical protein
MTKKLGTGKMPVPLISLKENGAIGFGHPALWES